MCDKERTLNNKTMKQVFVILDCLNDRGQGIVFRVVETLSAFVNKLPDFVGTDYTCSYNQDGSKPIWFPIEQLEEYPPLKVFYITFTNSEGGKNVFRIERRNVH